MLALENGLVVLLMVADLLLCSSWVLQWVVPVSTVALLLLDVEIWALGLQATVSTVSSGSDSSSVLMITRTMFLVA